MLRFEERIAELEADADGKTKIPPLAVLRFISNCPRIYKQRFPMQRKAIVSASFPRTSRNVLDANGVKYVVDTGYCKLSVYNPRGGTRCVLCYKRL